MLLALPLQVVPSKPSLQTHVPVMSSHDPWFEHKPSPGQSNSVDKYLVKITYISYHS